MVDPGPPSLVLASGSPRRRELLATLGLPFSVVVPGTDETPRPSDREDPAYLVERLARAKFVDGAVLIAQRQTVRPVPNPPVVIAADTIVVHDGEIVGKPRSEDHLCRLLRGYSGSSIEVRSGVAVGSMKGTPLVETVITRVAFTPFDVADMAGYVTSGEGADKAGGLSLQGGAGAIIESVDGCWSNVVGLPLCAVRRLLTQVGVSAPVEAGGDETLPECRR